MSNHSSQPTITPEYNDFSGVPASSGSASSNPYDALIHAVGGDVKQLQARYSAHREGRNGQQKEKLLSPEFRGVSVDPILLRLERPEIEPGFQDTRHCLVFWARPPPKIQSLVEEVQCRVGSVVPNLWRMPLHSLHMTALEITHSQPPDAIPPLIETLRPHMATITNYTSKHRARVIKPLVSFDAAALALSFLPGAGEGLIPMSSTPSITTDNAGRPRNQDDDAFSYHHLRRDLYDLATRAGVHVDSRYVVPSAHLTIGRFIEAGDFFVDGEEAKGVDKARVEALMRKVEEINEWLKSEYWPKDEESGDGKGIKDGGEWVVGEGKGLDCRMGTLWYGGGGETVMLGEGF